MYTEGTKNWKHMIYSHFLSEFERMNNDSFVNFKGLASYCKADTTFTFYFSIINA